MYDVAATESRTAISATKFVCPSMIMMRQCISQYLGGHTLLI